VGGRASGRPLNASPPESRSRECPRCSGAGSGGRGLRAVRLLDLADDLAWTSLRQLGADRGTHRLQRGSRRRLICGECVNRSIDVDTMIAIGTTSGTLRTLGTIGTIGTIGTGSSQADRLARLPFGVPPLSLPSPPPLAVTPAQGPGRTRRRGQGKWERGGDLVPHTTLGHRLRAQQLNH